jgi:hypothetical protein
MFMYSKRATVGGGLVVAVALAGALTALAPANAQSAIKQLISFACLDNQQCIKITNLSPTGNAIVGVAQNAPAILGKINVNTETNPNFPLGDFFLHGGVRGDDVSTNLLDTNAGVLGVSKNGQGVAGVTTAETSPFGSIGVLGADLSTTVNGNGGVVGISNHNAGVAGFSNDPASGVGGLFQDDGGVGLTAISNNGTGGIGIGSNGLDAYGFDTAGASLVIANFVGGPLIHAFSPNFQTEVLSLDSAGNLTIAGGLVQHGSPMAVNPTSAGTRVITYAPQQSVRTMEDVGEARLVAGQSLVRLEPGFASSIDTRRTYLVFLTPQGDNNGLYVAQKTNTGFFVREHNGASNIAFDYRIVAQPYGSASGRLPLYTEPRTQATAANEVERMQRILARVKSFHPRFHY